jgi:hypothetical protein
MQALLGPECPESLRYLWDWFQVLHGTRSYGMAGAERISLVEIDAANRLLGWQLRPEEVDALTTLDLVWLHPDVEQDADA